MLKMFQSPFSFSGFCSIVCFCLAYNLVDTHGAEHSLAE